MAAFVVTAVLFGGAAFAKSIGEPLPTYDHQITALGDDHQNVSGPEVFANLSDEQVVEMNSATPPHTSPGKEGAISSVPVSFDAPLEVSVAPAKRQV